MSLCHEDKLRPVRLSGYLLAPALLKAAREQQVGDISSPHNGITCQPCKAILAGDFAVKEVPLQRKRSGLCEIVGQLSYPHTV